MAQHGRQLLAATLLGLAALSAGAGRANEISVTPSPLLAVDQNRATVIDRIVAEFGVAFAHADTGLSVAQLRSILTGMRSDYLLAASLAGSLDGLRDVVSSSLISAASGKAARPKVLGDVADDLAYTPVTPCRILDTRGAIGGVMQGGQTRDWLAANPSGTFAGQGGAASNCGIPVKPAAVLANATVFNTAAGPAFFVAWPFNVARPNASTINWTSPATQVANAFILPLCTGGGCTFDFSAFVTSQTDVVIDVLGYFAAPIATALQCTQVASAGTTIAVSADTLVALPACGAGYTRTGSHCSGAGSIPSGYLLETNGAGCLYRNLSSVATFSGSATSVCCRVPGR